MTRLGEIAVIRLQNKRLSLFDLIAENYRFQEIITEQEQLIRKLNDRR